MAWTLRHLPLLITSPLCRSIVVLQRVIWLSWLLGRGNVETLHVRSLTPVVFVVINICCSLACMLLCCHSEPKIWLVVSELVPYLTKSKSSQFPLVVYSPFSIYPLSPPYSRPSLGFCITFSALEDPWQCHQMLNLTLNLVKNKLTQ